MNKVVINGVECEEIAREDSFRYPDGKILWYRPIPPKPVTLEEELQTIIGPPYRNLGIVVLGLCAVLERRFAELKK